MSHQLSLGKQFLGLLGWMLVTFAAASLGAVASVEASDFYQQLQQPAWSPPASVFGPVWTVLYLLMAISIWLVWRQSYHKDKKGVYALYLFQLALNALWSWLFFKWKLGSAASAEILILWVAILFTVILSWRIKPLAGLLLLPYFAWVSFAAALCYVIWKLNPALL